MKIKFSNFVKLFLAGASLLAVGCTDYGQDIQNLRDDMNDRFDALQTETIDPLRADLTQVQKDLAAAQEAIAAQQLKHDEDVKALQDADEALQKAIDAAAKKAADDLAALASELRGADAKLAEDLKNLSDELNNSIAETNKKVAANEQAIADAVKKAADELAAVKSELEGKLDAESKKLTDLINAEVEKLNNALAQTNAKHAEDIQALQNALAATEALLKQEIADAKEELTLAIAAGDAAVKSELEAKIDALENALNNKIAALESDFNSKIAAANAAISKANEDIAKNAAAIDALKTALADAKAELEKAIADGDAKLAADLAQAVADLTALIEGYVKDLQDQVNTINTEIAGLKTVDADLQNQINALVAALAATNEKVATNAENIAANAEAIAKNADNINHNADAIKALDAAVSDLEAALDSHVAEFVAYKAEVAGLFAAVNAEIAILHAKDAEIEGLIAKLDERLKANEELAAQNAKDIAANKAAFDEYVAATAETLRLMQEAHDALATRVGNLENDLTAHKEAIRKELDEHYAAFADYQKEVAEDFAAVNETLAAHTAAIKANADAIEANKAAIAANEAAIAALDVRLTALEDAHAELENKHNKLQDDFDAYVAKTDGVIASIQAEQIEQNNTLQLHAQQIADLDQAVKDLDAKVDAIKAELEKKITDLEQKLQDQIDALVGDVEELKARIQSIVYVPEYTDGMATIEYAMFGNKIIECNSVMTYQVHPANCASAVKKEDLSFLFQGLKTRAAVAENVQLEVVGVKVTDATKGYIAITVQAHNLGDNFYNGRAINNDFSHYAVSLVFNHKVANVENNIASCYTTLIAEKADNAAVISMGILNNKDKEIFDPQAQPVESHEIIYSDLETKKEFMPGNYPVFKLGNGKWFTYEQIVSAGYQISQPQQTITYAYFDKEGKETNTFKSVYNNVEAGEGYEYVTTNLAKVEKLAVKSYETVTYTYATDGTSVSTTGKLTITKDKGTFNLGEATVAWARNLDNNVTVFSRDNIGYVLAEKVLAGKSTSYAEAVAGTLTTLTVNGADILANAWDLTDDKMSAELVKVAADAEPVLKFEGFEWNKTYTFVAVYELDNIDVTINFAVKTVLPKYTINLEEMVITWNYAQDWKSTFGSENTNRELTVVVKDSKAEYTENAVPAYADVIKNGVQNSLTAPEPTYELLENIIKCSKFEWNKSYAFAAEYALADALVTINGSVKTVKTLKNIVVTLPESTQDILPNLVINETDHAINDVLADAFTEQNIADLCLGTTTVEEYLSAIFADASLPKANIEANKRTTDKDATVVADATTTTNLFVNADGQSANTFFAYTDGYSPIPDAVVYRLTVKTWYDVQITFVKKLNFKLISYGVYDYNAVRDFVSENATDGYYFSTAIPYYFMTPDNSQYMSDILVELNMNTAFNVVNTETGVNVVLDADGKNTTLGLVSKFSLGTGVHGSGISLVDNHLKYHDTDPSVAVKAQLSLVNTDGSLVAVIPTQFDEKNKNGEEGIYYDYIVNQYDPIQKADNTHVSKIQFNIQKDAKTYVSYIMNGIQLYDKREHDVEVDGVKTHRSGYELIAKGKEIKEGDPDYRTDVMAYHVPTWLVGNGPTDGSAVNNFNGYSVNAHVDSIYGLKVVSMGFNSDSDRNKVADLLNTGALTIDFTAPGAGKITFVNGNQIKLTESVLFNLKVQVDYVWGTRSYVVPVEFIVEK